MSKDSTNPSAQAPSKSRIFVARLSSTLLLWGIVGSALWLDLPWMMTGLLAFLGIAGTREYMLFQRKDAVEASFRWLVVGCSALYWVGILFYGLKNQQEPPLWLDLVIVALVAQLAFVLSLTRAPEGDITLRRIFNSVFAVVYTVVLWGFMAKLLFLNESEGGRWLVLLVVLVTKFGDMGAYCLGSLIGKHKMIPHISPAKTWEGFLGAILASMVGMMLLMSIFGEALLPLTWKHALILAPLLAIWGVIGDLAESILKRCHGVKDSGQTLPGIGGILDLTDSLLFTAPLFYFYLKAIS